MGKLITIHSYKGGTGKSYLSVNLATIYALQGKRVCLVDLDFRAPTQHVVFDPKNIKCFVNSVLDGACSVKDCLIDCSDKIDNKGELYVGFADFSTEAIREMISKGKKWEIEALQRLYKMRKELIDDLKFDIIIGDTSPGIQYLSINAVVAADVSVIVSTLDEADIMGTQKMLKELYETFEKETAIIINKAIGGADLKDLEKDKIIQNLQSTYKEAVIGILPCFCEVGRMRRGDIFVMSNPKHPFTDMLRVVAAKLDLF
jgi:septum site-determining protein MinD